MISEFCPRSDVLNVGCGEAVLWQYLPMGKSYFGIEPSAKAGESARARNAGAIALSTALARTSTPVNAAGIVLSSTKCCIYSRHPLALLDKYSNLIKHGGKIIVSIYQKPGSLIKAQRMYWLDRNRTMSKVLHKSSS